MKGRVLIVAGSDSGGGAGIQADIKTVTALKGYAAAAITALTAQNTRGVYGIVDVAPEFIVQQMKVVLSDIGADVIKFGMLHTAGAIEAVVEVLGSDAAGVPVVVDPVMIAKGGALLMEESAQAVLRLRLLPRASVITPNLLEAQALAGVSIENVEGMIRAGERLRELGPPAVLVKGGHLAGNRVTDVLVTEEGVERFEGPRVETRHTHGTGCTLASGIATGLAQGRSLVEAVLRARAYLIEALRTAPGLGSGHGPLNHAHTVRPFGGGETDP